MAVRSSNSVALIMVLVAAAIVESLAANTYHVGNTSGWKVPSGGLTFSNWAAQHTFVEGDILMFDFTTGQHTAAKVIKNYYDNCNISDPINVEVTGPANYTLSSGESYFICTISNHCSQGQKLAVKVTTSSSAGSPSGSPAPGSSPGTHGSPPPPSSATPTAVVASSLIFVSIFMAFFC